MVADIFIGIEPNDIIMKLKVLIDSSVASVVCMPSIPIVANTIRTAWLRKVCLIAIVGH